MSKTKVIYKPPATKSEKYLNIIMKIMVQDICRGVDIEELFSAENDEGKKGIYCSTELGGKKFWTFEELEKLFISKNGEKGRFRVENDRT
jgi:hypothetical protein